MLCILLQFSQFHLGWCGLLTLLLLFWGKLGNSTYVFFSNVNHIMVFRTWFIGEPGSVMLIVDLKGLFQPS